MRPLCTIDECGQPNVARGWCDAHYRRWRRYGDPLADRPKPSSTCSVESCEDKVLARGWCSVHYQRWRSHGDPTVKKPGGRGRVGAPPVIVHGTATAYNNHGCRCEPCKENRRSYAREWAQANPEKRRRTRLKFLYDISPEEYAVRMFEQGCVCAICGEAQDKDTKRPFFHVDHCHKDGHVRGLLCRPCNQALGLLRDDPVRMQKATDYLLAQTDVLKGLAS